jgi:cell division transport system permease protein
MKIRTIKLLAKEGANNVVKNKLMSFASMMTVVVALFILGIVLLMAINITSNIEAMKRDLELTVFLNVNATPYQREEVVNFVEAKKDAGLISEYRIETKEQMYENIKNSLEDESLLEGFTVENAAESFYIKLVDPNSSDAIISQISEFGGVNKNAIGYGKEELDKLEGILKIFNSVTIIVLAVLMIISIFLISNTIKLTVYARRHQIEIMKYIGAVDSFIRGPFIVEGFILGLLGAAVAFLLTSQAYTLLQKGLNVLLTNLNLSTLRIMPFSPVAVRMFIIYAIFGIVIGGVGSVVSVRKHLNV